MSLFNRKVFHVTVWYCCFIIIIVAVSIVTTRLVYCNSLFRNVTATNSARLQRVQNTLARVLLWKRKFDHITSSLMELHWLPIQQRVYFKVALLTHNIIHPKELDSLFNLVKFYEPVCTLRSSSRGMLSTNRTRTVIGSHPFRHLSASIWTCPSLLTFVTVIAPVLLDVS